MRVQSILCLLGATLAYAAPVADADYAPQPYEKPTPKPYEPKPTYGSPKEFNPLEVLSDAAIAVIRFKLALIKEGAKIILSPFEAAYAAAHDLQPEYPQQGKTYARDADYAPKPTYGKPSYEAPKGDDLLDGLSEAAIELLRWKLALIKAGFKIILSPLEQAFNDKYHPAPSEYPPKGYYA